MIHDAVIIGAGPAGSTAALQLARAGWNVAIVEKASFPRKKVCGEYMSATNLELLDRLGIGDAWRSNAGPEIRRVGFFSGDVAVDANMPAARGGYGRAVGRDILDSLLLQAAQAAGTHVLQPYRAVGIERHGESQTVSVESRTGSASLIAPVVIAAHGSWEPGALPTQPDKSVHASGLLGFKAHFAGAALAPDLMPLLVFPGGYGGMVTSDHGRVSLSCCIRRDTLAGLRMPGGADSAGTAVLRHLVRSCRSVGHALRDAELDGRWMAAGPIRPGIRVACHDDIFRVGNAAGESHPIIAEGISMAIQSGWLLASALVQAGRKETSNRSARERIAHLYERSWRRQFSPRIHAAAAIASLSMQPFGPALMRTGIRSVPRLLTLGAALSGKTTAVPGL